MSHFNQVFQANELLFANPLNAVTSRTTFDRSHTRKTTGFAGKLIPIYYDEVLPGDTHLIDFSYMVRMSTPIVPIADNAVLDFHFFFVPNRILWGNWKKFMGENTSSWAVSSFPAVPHLYDSGANIGNSLWITQNGYAPHDLAAYLGLPIGYKFLGGNSVNSTRGQISALPFAAYCQIWNDWYRDQNVQNEILIPFKLNDGINNNGYAVTQVVVGQNWFDGLMLGFGLAPVSKLPDYFTTCLPAPQKGVSATFGGLGGYLTLPALPVVNAQPRSLNLNHVNGQYINYAKYSGSDELKQKHIYQFLGSRSEVYTDNQPYLIASNSDAGVGNLIRTSSSNRQQADGFLAARSPKGSNIANFGVDTRAFYHDLTTEATSIPVDSSGATINDLRLAFAVQQFLEIDARGGSRYIEVLKNHFGVISPDARLQRAEYIGGKRDYINVQQVLATTEGQDQKLGETGAYSLTNGHSGDSMVYSATEHGFIMGFVTIRNMNTYGQGIDKSWTRMSRYDYYWPVFDSIGEQPVYKREIFAGNDTATNNELLWDEVFGYNEAWAEYRYAHNRVTGLFAPNGKQGSSYLSAWAFTDRYTNRPTLNEQWMISNKDNIGQTLGSLDFDQFLFDFYFSVKSTRPMSMFGIPGLTRM